MEHVYPKMKEYCRDRHGLEFQVTNNPIGLTKFYSWEEKKSLKYHTK